LIFQVQKVLVQKTNSKKDIITEIAATMAFSATQNNDKIGVDLFSDELYIPPKKGRIMY
jgi:uncharacterized protein (DUF58 family)